MRRSIRQIFFSIILAGFMPFCVSAQLKSSSFEWRNPITRGLNPFGQKDFHLIKEGDLYYLTASEMKAPAKQEKGLVLYVSKDLLNWSQEKLLFDRKNIDSLAWYRDEWQSPKIHKINNRFYLTFSNRNNKLRPYKKLGFGLAVADKISGPYTILNENKPLAYGAHFTLLADDEGKIFSYWDLDGRIYAAQIDPKKAEFITQPFEMLGPKSMSDFNYLDAPFVAKKDNIYYLIYSSFYGGYVVKINYLTAASPLGPWKKVSGEPLVTFIEAEANEVQRMKYPPGFSFAPPTQVIFNNQLFKGPGDRYYIAYHSSEKYAEPYLMIEPVEFNTDGTFYLPAKKKINQKVTW